MLFTFCCFVSDFKVHMSFILTPGAKWTPAAACFVFLMSPLYTRTYKYIIVFCLNTIFM